MVQNETFLWFDITPREELWKDIADKLHTIAVKEHVIIVLERKNTELAGNLKASKERNAQLTEERNTLWREVNELRTRLKNEVRKRDKRGRYVPKEKR